MDTTIFTNGGMDACGAYCMDIVTAGLVTMATLAVMVLTGVYALAGICKRVR